jgi:hypothetical protein
MIANIYLAQTSECVCTTVDCPVEGKNNIVMGGGYANIEYIYQQHGEHEVVVSASGTITPKSLDNGTGTTTCTQEYSRMMEDDGDQDCDAGHILANRLGGYGNVPINIFPQSATVNRGTYAQFEGSIYDCIQSGALSSQLSWEFNYDNLERTMPTTIKYSATFDGGNCTTLSSLFPN